MEENSSEQRDRMTTMGELAAILAHEIKNPMNSIIINLEVLKGSLPDLCANQDSRATKKLSKYLEVIEGEIKRLEKVFAGFLDLANPPQTTKIKFQPNLLIRSIADLMRFELKQKGIELDLQLEDSQPSLVGSSDQIKQAMINLIINATQAMPKGGTIVVSTKAIDGNLQIQIKDEGRGIPEDIRGQIFSPYFTTKEKGSGLGLAIVRRIVREHGGFIDVESEENKGTVFSLVFPRKNESTEPN